MANTTSQSIEAQLKRLFIVPLVCLSVMALIGVAFVLSLPISALSAIRQQFSNGAIFIVIGLFVIWAIALIWVIVQQRRIVRLIVDPIQDLSSTLRTVEMGTIPKGFTAPQSTTSEVKDLYQAVAVVFKEITTVRQLNQRLSEAMESKDDVAVEVARLQLESEKDSLTDPLTQVNNRRCMERDFPIAIQQSLKGDTPLCFAMSDIDHFKHFNDTYGHQTGDEVLQQFAAVLKEGVRDSDRVYRYGGEEFGIIFRRADLEQAFHACNRIREQVSISFKERDLNVTASFGVAMYSEAIGSSDELVSHADQALYRAKEGGRNRVEADEPGATPAATTDAATTEPAAPIVPESVPAVDHHDDASTPTEVAAADEHESDLPAPAIEATPMTSPSTPEEQTNSPEGEAAPPSVATPVEEDAATESSANAIEAAFDSILGGPPAHAKRTPPSPSPSPPPPSGSSSE